MHGHWPGQSAFSYSYSWPWCQRPSGKTKRIISTQLNVQIVQKSTHLMKTGSFWWCGCVNSDYIPFPKIHMTTKNGTHETTTYYVSVNSRPFSWCPKMVIHTRSAKLSESMVRYPISCLGRLVGVQGCRLYRCVLQKGLYDFQNATSLGFFVWKVRQKSFILFLIIGSWGGTRKTSLALPDPSSGTGPWGL